MIVNEIKPENGFLWVIFFAVFEIYFILSEESSYLMLPLCFPQCFLKIDKSESVHLLFYSLTIL